MSARNLRKLISTYLDSVQELETSTNAVYRSRFVDEAEGVQLDGLGALVGRDRLGLDDTAYRIAIKTQIRLNLSSGTVADLQAIFLAALGSDYTLDVQDQGVPSAEFQAILSPDVDASQVAQLRQLLQDGKAAGVYGVLRTTTGNNFRFAGGSGPSRGFGVGSFASAG